MNHLRSTRQVACRDVSLGLLLGFVALTLTACSSLHLKMPWSDPDPVDYALISKNLVDAVGQYPRLNPLLATVQVSRPDNAFERQVHEEMRARGYKVISGDADEEALAVVADIQSGATDATNAAPLYTLVVGQTSVERRYQLVDGKTQPASQMIVRGAPERVLVTNDEQVFPETDALYRSVLFQPTAETVALAEPVATPEIPEIAAANAVEAAMPEQESMLIKQNLYDTGQSNYTPLFSDYEEVEKSVLVFPNDSLQLGDTNKQIIERYVSEMDPSTDILSVIGCSHGTTAINNGNSLLAVGRANRVKEAFMFSGVDHDLVMEEGCWAPVRYENMPSRGVVLTLKRRKDS